MISSSLGRCSSAAVQRRAARTAAGCARAPLSSSHGRTGSGALCTRAAGSSIGVNASAAGGAAARAAAAAALAAALVLGGGGAPAWAALGPQPRGDVAALAAAAAGDDVMDQYDADMEQLADVSAAGGRGRRTWIHVPLCWERRGRAAAARRAAGGGRRWPAQAPAAGGASDAAVVAAGRGMPCRAPRGSPSARLSSHYTRARRASAATCVPTY